MSARRLTKVGKLVAKALVGEPVVARVLFFDLLGRVSIDHPTLDHCFQLAGVLGGSGFPTLDQPSGRVNVLRIDPSEGWTTRGDDLKRSHGRRKEEGGERSNEHRGTFVVAKSSFRVAL